MSWIQVNQTETVEPAQAPASIQYRLIVEVVRAVDIDPELFVFRVTDDEYSHVATYKDLLIYPASKTAALDAEALYYRTNRVELVFADKIKAVTVSEALHARLQRVNLDWGGAQATNFGGVATYVYDSRDAP